MRILIISTPRSGSTTLTESLCRLLLCDSYHEPFNNDHPALASKSYPTHLPSSMVLKTMFFQLPNDEKDPFNFYSNKLGDYDKVIILSRKDVHASYESFNHNIKNNQNGNWHKEYIYKEKDFNIELFNQFLKWTSDIIEFSFINNIPITWYEDLYSYDLKVRENSILNMNLELNTNDIINELNKFSKYRKFNKQSFI